jgi:hypothetical protein
MLIISYILFSYLFIIYIFSMYYYCIYNKEYTFKAFFLVQSLQLLLMLFLAQFLKHLL